MESECTESRQQPRKHRIDFADATAFFVDERALTVRDEITAVDEIRMLTLGRDAMGRPPGVASILAGSQRLG